MSNVIFEEILDKQPGMGINANPFEAEITIDLTAPIGSLSGMYYSLMFQLGRNGFAIFKIDEAINVSPVFKQYYDLTVHQEQALEGEVKAGLGQIATAIHDYELVWHDLRKYKEYMDYYTIVERGHEKAKSKKKEEKEEGEKMVKEGTQTLRSVFIDQVDAHTGEGLAIRTMPQRWPTIIVDFMRLDDKDKDQKEIAKKYGISEAEASILATKNKLFMEWRDNLFKPTLKGRYQHILRLTEARKTSIEKYTEALKPTIARYKILSDAVSNPNLIMAGRRSFFQPASQAYSMDMTRTWAFMPFAPSEKYKVTREFLDEISPNEAGFKNEEIEQLIKAGKLEKKKKIPVLPVEPSIDGIVRKYIPEVEKFYDVKITAVDIYNARKRLTDLFLRTAMETRGGMTSQRLGDATAFLKPGATWVFSPYFVFLDIPFPRTVIRLPNGTELENIMIENMTVKNRTQNVIIICLLEVIAREKQLENYVSELVGEVSEGGVKISDLAKDQYPEIYAEGGKEKKKEKKKGLGIGGLLNIGRSPGFQRFRSIWEDVVAKGLGLRFDWLRARGPYEFAMDDRISEMFQLETMYKGYLFVLRFLQSKSGVPGVRV